MNEDKCMAEVEEEQTVPEISSVDILRIKNKFLENIEELRMLRVSGSPYFIFLEKQTNYINKQTKT